jgi:hypothetical protein
MYNVSLLILTFLFGFFANSQELHHQMIGAQGGSYLVGNSIQVEQSIGQVTVHGYQADSNAVLQGFQQNVWYRLAGPNKEQIAIKLFPNPFVETINFSFSKPLNYPLKLSLFDLLGRVITEKTIQKNTQESAIVFPVLAAAEYIVVLSSPEINQSFKIIKK